MAKEITTPKRPNRPTKMQQYYLDICDRFLLARMEQKMTQSEWARTLDITESYVKSIELRRFTPTLFAIKALKKKFGYCYDWIVDGEGPKKIK